MSHQVNHKEAARILGINERTLTRLVAEAEIQRVKRGREILYNEDDIKGLLSSSSRAVEDVRVYMIGTPLVSIKSFYHQDGAGHVAGSGTFYDFRHMMNHILAKYYSEPTDQNEPSDGDPEDQNDTPVAQNATPEDQKGSPGDQFDTYNSEHKNNKTTEYGDGYILYERDGWQFRRDRTIKYLPDDEVFAIRDLQTIFHPSHSVLQDTIRLYGIDDS